MSGIWFRIHNIVDGFFELVDVTRVSVGVLQTYPRYSLSGNHVSGCSVVHLLPHNLRQRV